MRVLQNSPIRHSGLVTFRLRRPESRKCLIILDTGLRDCVAIGENSFKIVIPAKAGIQKLLKLLDSVSRFACTE